MMNDTKMLIKILVHTGKFFDVANFAKLPLDTSEEISPIVFFYAAYQSDHTPTH